MDQKTSTVSSTNGASTAHELFALTDEQILEIEPTAEVASDEWRVASENDATVISSEAKNPSFTDKQSGPAQSKRDPSVAPLSRNDGLHAGSSGTGDTRHQSQVTHHESAEPPPWLATQMKDPWSGEEAKEFWNGVLQARSEAAAYRAALATPEDARALKELYPGGLDEARAAANRARLLDQIDRAYFGVPGGSAEQINAARADLAQRMLREDPAAFREMVFAGLRALEATEKGSTGAPSVSNPPPLAQVFASNRYPTEENRNSKSETRNSGDNPAQPPSGSASNFDLRVSSKEHQSPVPSHESLSSAYAAFEKAANEDLERSVGAAITRTIEQALPNLTRSNSGEREGARQGVPLQDRLSAAVRQDVEAALKGDRQLGEQIAQILSARRLDNETRAQVVRLIDDRARQLVPGAARRVINDWTQTTLAAHRGNAARADAANTRREVEPLAAQGPLPQGLPAGQAGASPAALSSRAAQTRPGADSHRNASRPDARRLDYRKLSDEQILDL